MVQRYIHVLFRIAAVLMLGVCMSCQIGEMFEPVMPDYPKEGEYMTLAMQSSKLLPHQVATRASDPKTEAEKAINHMHILYFNSDTGELLEPYTDPKTEKARFFPYVETDLTVIKIDKHAMLEANVRTDTNNNPKLPESLKVYVCVLANMENIIDGVDSEGMPLIGGEVVTMDIMQAKAYEHPSKASGGAALLSLPKTGMPMVGQEAIDLKKDMDINNLTVELHALMARVDFSIKIDAPVYEENLPKLTMQNWSVHNLPTQVSLNNSSNAVTTLAATEYTEASMINNQIIINKNGTVNFSFYMFENIQDAEQAPTDYPEKDEYKPKYKPLLANDNATYVILDALYTTYDNKVGYESTYDVKYKIYLGANHTNDFKVKRNYQYKNDITIVGLTNNDWSNVDGEISEITFDARVNISESNPYYISILNERAIDAHIGVLPMDVYFFGTAGTQKIVVSVDKDWVGMEKVSADQMANGAVSSELQEAMGAGYKAGHGKRKYFTVGLVNDLRTEATSIELTKSRDRIYFYIDENLVLEDREAIITLEYYENGVLNNTEQRKIDQTHLLPVEVVHNGTTYRTVYMEAIEEYLDNYDPLDEFNSTMVYDGLPWGFDGEIIDDVSYANKAYDNYWDGLVYTLQVLNNEKYNIKNYTLNSINASVNAFLYCYNKNKRCSTDGSIFVEFTKNSGFWNANSFYDNNSDKVSNQYQLWPGNHAKWFLPGISQLEAGLETYFNNYPEFNGNMYWSSAAGKKTTGSTGFLGIVTYSYTASINHARATNLTVNGNHVNSEYKTIDNGTPEIGEGYKLRTAICRVRAFRWDLEPMTSH